MDMIYRCLWRVFVLYIGCNFILRWSGSCTWDLRFSWQGSLEEMRQLLSGCHTHLDHTPLPQPRDMVGGWETEEPLKHLSQSDTPSTHFLCEISSDVTLQHWSLSNLYDISLYSTAPCLPLSLPARIKCLICCHAKNSSTHRTAMHFEWKQPPNGSALCYIHIDGRNSSRCTAYLLPRKFHVSLTDLASQLASQLQLTPSTTYKWRLPPPPYAACVCISPIAWVNIHEISACVRPLLIGSTHVCAHF